MPFYDFRCPDCEQSRMNVFLKIADIDRVMCSGCLIPMKVIIRPIALDIWKSKWMEHIDNKPQFVESKKQLKKICAKNDLTCYATADGVRGDAVKEV